MVLRIFYKQFVNQKITTILFQPLSIFVHDVTKHEFVNALNVTIINLQTYLSLLIIKKNGGKYCPISSPELLSFSVIPINDPPRMQPTCYSFATTD